MIYIIYGTIQTQTLRIVLNGKMNKHLLPDVNSFIDERVNLIVSEFMVSAKWRMPCISLAVFRSEYTKEYVLLKIQNTAGLAGKDVVHLRIDKKLYDIPVILRDDPDAANRIFSISGLRWGGGRGYSNAYRALNMHREYLVESRALSIFWLTPKEARQAARFAPDFWAFRHIVVEFLDLPSGSKFTSADIDFEKSKETIAACLVILKKDPHEPGALRELAKHYHALKCYEDAVFYFRKALRNDPGDEELMNSLAESYQAMKHSNGTSVIDK